MSRATSSWSVLRRHAERGRLHDLAHQSPGRVHDEVLEREQADEPSLGIDHEDLADVIQILRLPPHGFEGEADGVQLHDRHHVRGHQAAGRLLIIAEESIEVAVFRHARQGSVPARQRRQFARAGRPRRRPRVPRRSRRPAMESSAATIDSGCSSAGSSISACEESSGGQRAHEASGARHRRARPARRRDQAASR